MPPKRATPPASRACTSVSPLINNVVFDTATACRRCRKIPEAEWLQWQGGPRRSFAPASPAGLIPMHAYPSTHRHGPWLCCGPGLARLVWFPRSQEKLYRFVLHRQGAAEPRRWGKPGTAWLLTLLSFLHTLVSRFTGHLSCFA